MARIRSQRREMQLAPLLLLAGAASTSATFSLSSFQLIAQSSVPISCILAYNNIIAGCVAADFENGNTCSAACVRGIEVAQSNIQSACEGVPAPANTVLGQGLLGNLVELLCPGGAGDSQSTVIQISRGTTTQIQIRTTSTRVPESTTDLPPAAEPSTFVPPQPDPVPATTATLSIPGPTQTPESDLGGSQPGGSPFSVFSGATSSLRSPPKWIEVMAAAGAIAFALLR